MTDERFYADPVANRLALHKRFNPAELRGGHGQWIAGLGSLGDKLNDAGYNMAAGAVGRAAQHASAGDMEAAHRSLDHARDAVRGKHQEMARSAPRAGEVRPDAYARDDALRSIEQARSSQPDPATSRTTFGSNFRYGAAISPQSDVEPRRNTG